MNFDLVFWLVPIFIGILVAATANRVLKKEPVSEPAKWLVIIIAGSWAASVAGVISFLLYHLFNLIWT